MPHPKPTKSRRTISPSVKSPSVKSPSVKSSGAKLPPVCVVEITARDEDGDYLARPILNKGKDKLPEKNNVEITIIAEQTLQIGTRLLVRLRQIAPQSWRAKIIRILGSQSDPREQRIVAQIRKRHNGVFIESLARTKHRTKHGNRDIVLKFDKTKHQIKDGDIIIADIVARGQAEFIEHVGNVDTPHAFSLIALAEQEIPIEFSPQIIEAANAIKDITDITLSDKNAPPLRENSREDLCENSREDLREDLQNLPFITIDPHDARDHDDAVYVEPHAAPSHEGGVVVWVAIADVAAYVHERDALDSEARRRGNSVYLPDRVVPMLPDALSTDLCSLKPHVPRPCLAVRMVFDRHGIKQSHQFHRGMMRSHAKLSYEQAQGVFENAADAETFTPEIMDALKNLWRAHKILMTARQKRSPLALDMPEQRVHLDSAGSVSRIEIAAHLDAHSLIENMMIMANVAAAETLQAHRLPLIYRIHAQPELDRIRALADFVKPFGLKYDLGQPPHPRLFNRILERAADEHRPIMMDSVLRTQAQAVYSIENVGHFGLSLSDYAHFTSPIRRYADLLVHRALIRALRLGRDGLSDAELRDLEDIAAHVSQAERRGIAAERAAIARYLSAHMSSRIGETFDATISGISRAGIFVRVLENGADGFIPMSQLGNEYFTRDAQGFTLTGRRSGLSYHLGASLAVVLAEAVPLQGNLRFRIVESKKQTQSAKLKFKSQFKAGQRRRAR